MFSKIALSCGALTDPRLAVVGLRLAIRRLGRFLLDFPAHGLTGSYCLGSVTGRLGVQAVKKVSAASHGEALAAPTTRPR